MDTSSSTRISRGQALAGTAAALAGFKFPAPAIAQGAINIKMTLPGLPQGSQFFAFVARNRGYWKTRGLNVDIARGFGSAGANQTIPQGQMQAGTTAAPSVRGAAAQTLD